MPKIKVLIRATQRVFYRQVCEMEEKDYRRYLAMVNRHESDEAIDREFADWIDTREISDGSDIEDLELSRFRERPKAKEVPRAR